MPQSEMFDQARVDKVMVLRELRRELGMRGTVYPAHIRQGRITQFEADMRVACLRKAVEIVEGWNGD